MTESAAPEPRTDTNAGPDVGDTAIALLAELIRFDTTNYGGGRSQGERDAAEFVADQLRSVGFEPEILHLKDAPERANVVVRIPGKHGDAAELTPPGALLVHAHLDVVPAEPDQWSFDPFVGDIVDGYVRGRGAHDMKDMCAMTLASVLALGRNGIQPNRDLVIAFVADEEDKGDWGAAFLVEQHPDLFAGVGAAISESGAVFQPIAAPDGSTARLYPIATAERGTMHLRLTARGVSGHGSRPGPRMAVTDLLEAVQRIARHRWPVHLSPAVRGFLTAVGNARGLSVDLSDDAGVERCLAELGEDAGVARFTVRAASTPTMLNAGYKVNVIPGVATAEIDVRCPPGYDEELQATLAELIGPDVSYEFTAFQRPVAADPDSPWFDALGDAVRRHDPDAVIAPFCMGGGTDAKAFATLGIQCYGFAPLGEDPDGRREGGVHGVDERVPVESVRWGARVIYDLLRTV